MRTYIVLLTLTIACFLQDCKKPEGDDLSGEYEVNGKLVMVNTLTNSTQETILPGETIKIKTDSNSVNYLFTVTTDKNGHFLITNLSGRPYFLYAEKKVNDILYTGTIKIDPQSALEPKLILSPAANDYNILSLTTKDGSAFPANLLTNVNIYLYNTWSQANENDSAAVVWKAKTNSFGQAQVTNLAPGWYYLNASQINGKKKLEKLDSVQINATGIFSKEILLNLSTSFDLTGEIFINDTLSGYPEEVPVQAQAILIKKEADSANQHFFRKVTSNDQGIFTSEALPAGKYWLVAEKTVNGILYFDTAIINSGIYTKMVMMPTARNYNILQIITRDSATTGLLNNASVCLFSSRQVADSSECENSIITGNSNKYGRFSTTRLPAPGKYFINAQFSIGTKKLIVKDSVELNETGITSKTVFLK